jgi:membrane protein YqaA with SNARE-associated domain
MENILLHNGLPALFILSFFAATVIPLGSEWLLVALLLQGHGAAPVVAVATIGNFLGGCTTYGIGYLGSTFIMGKILRISDQETGKAVIIYQRYGSWSLLFSWVPIIGDPLCLVAGSLKLHPLIFSLFVFSGKLARYAMLAQITIRVVEI